MDRLTGDYENLFANNKMTDRERYDKMELKKDGSYLVLAILVIGFILAFLFALSSCRTVVLTIKDTDSTWDMADGTNGVVLDTANQINEDGLPRAGEMTSGEIILPIEWLTRDTGVVLIHGDSVQFYLRIIDSTTIK